MEDTPEALADLAILEHLEGDAGDPGTELEVVAQGFDVDG